MGQPYDTEVPTEFGLGLHHVQLAVVGDHVAGELRDREAQLSRAEERGS